MESVIVIDEKLLCVDCKINPTRGFNKRGRRNIRCESCYTIFHASYRKRHLDKIASQLADANITDKVCCVQCLSIKPIDDFICNNTRLTMCRPCRVRHNRLSAEGRKTFCERFWSGRASGCTTRLRKAASEVSRQESIETTIRAKPFVIEIKGKVLAEIFSEQKGKCFYCCADLEPEYTSVDHATPVSRGGDNHRDNIHIACDGCNRLKGELNAQEFIEFRQEYIKRPGKQIIIDTSQIII